MWVTGDRRNIKARTRTTKSVMELWSKLLDINRMKSPIVARIKTGGGAASVTAAKVGEGGERGHGRRVPRLF